MADRRLLHKLRKRHGFAVFRVEANVADLSEALIEAGLLRWERAEDRPEIERALNEAVRRMITDGDMSPGAMGWCARHGDE
jgi:hypothetical protein